MVREAFEARLLPEYERVICCRWPPIPRFEYVGMSVHELVVFRGDERR